tara:strand:- start:1768 stop:2973 length:1206 start_codon:yes stop_codon:yes gene_type:complete
MRMHFRFILALGLGLPLSQAAAANHLLRVDAGQHERSGTPVTFPLPDGGQAHWQLTDPSGNAVAIQTDGLGSASFIVGKLAAFQTAVYKLSPAAKPTHANVVSLVKQSGKLRITIGDRTVLHYQAEKSRLPRADLNPIYRRGGYIHPVVTPGGTVITDDYPRNHKHHHGIWFPWTNTIFEGRKPDFWNMGNGTGTVEFTGLHSQWSGPVHAGFSSSHQFVDLIAKPLKVALTETWRVQVYATGKAYHLFGLESVQRCAGGSKILFPQYRYGGLGFRGHGDWDGKENCFYLTANGESDRIKGHATRARWCHVGGRTGGKLGGIGVLCHPGNFRFPQPMRIHPSEPFFNFAPSQTGDWEIKPGEEYVSRYRFVVTDGKPDAALLERLWRDYAHPPRVEVYAAE